MDLKKNFSSNLMQMMDERGVNRSQLARALQVSDSAVSKWLLMKREPTLSNIYKIIQYLKCTFEDLVQD
jgi:transcriptional regulator with XRE-family HTH domain